MDRDRLCDVLADPDLIENHANEFPRCVTDAYGVVRMGDVYVDAEQGMQQSRSSVPVGNPKDTSNLPKTADGAYINPFE